MECCGIVGHDGAVVPLENTHHDPKFNFLIDNLALTKAHAEHGIAAIYHSHCNFIALPSGGDLELCSWYSLPYLIVSVWPDHGHGLNAQVCAFLLELDNTPYGKHFRGAPEVLECM